MRTVDEAVLAKAGQELFRELLRLYPVADPDDYFRGGAWRDDVMKMDIRLVWTHRREAGAPDPVPLEQVKMPELPPGAQTRRAGAVGAAGARPAAAAGKAVAGKAGAPAPAVELRLIALFVAKWKLEPSRTKLMLARLTPARRRYVIQKFKASAPGAGATEELEQYIADCAESNVWATAAGPSMAPSAAVTPTASSRLAAAAGTKRPLASVIPSSASSKVDSKRPRIPAARSVTPSIAPSSAITPSSARPTPSRPAAQQLRPAGSVNREPPPDSLPQHMLMQPRAKGAPKPSAPKPAAPKQPAAAPKPGEMIRNLLDTL